ncbi:hypothetical protein Tco_0825364 [Tanacetum coccineum]
MHVNSKPKEHVHGFGYTLLFAKVVNSPNHVDNFNVHLENSHEQLENSPDHVENSHVHGENSTDKIENSPDQVENSSVHVEHSHVHLENSPNLSGETHS